MIDWVVATFTALAVGYIITIPGLLILALIGIFLVHDDSNKTAVFIGLVLLLAGVACFNIPLSVYIKYAAIYLVVGVLWSFWRYKRYVTYCVANRKYRSKYGSSWIEYTEKGSTPGNEMLTEMERRSLIESLHPSKNLDRIISWILIWPFSVVEMAAGDIIDLVTVLVRGVFKGVYLRVYLGAVAPLLQESNKDSKK